MKSDTPRKRLGKLIKFTRSRREKNGAKIIIMHECITSKLFAHKQKQRNVFENCFAC